MCGANKLTKLAVQRHKVVGAVTAHCACGRWGSDRSLRLRGRTGWSTHGSIESFAQSKIGFQAFVNQTRDCVFQVR